MTENTVGGFVVSGFTAVDDPASPPAALSTAGTASTPEPGASPGDSGQVAATSAGHEHKRRRWWPRGFLPNALIGLAAFGLVTGSCLDTCTRMNTVRHVPAIHGRVVDMETGQPLAGVRVTRWFERDMIVGPGGSDTYRVKGSLRTVTSDTAGRFEFPAWYGIGRGINAVQWTEYKPGWVAGWGHLVTANPLRFEIARKHRSFRSVEAETRREGSTATIVLKLHRVDTPSTAEEHFWALRSLLDNRVIQKDDFVEEAASYVEAHSLTEGMIADVASLVPLGPCTTPYCHDPRIHILARGVVSYCEHTPASAYCKPRAAVMIRQLREWLEEEQEDGQ